METLDQWATPASILIGIIFGAAQVKAAIESLRHAVDRLDPVSYTHLRAHETN